MKVKTEAKRLSILEEAAEVFREHGFERASMAEIRARVGGSKATLYNYFSSKEELFFEVMMKASEGDFEAAHDFLDPEKKGVAFALCDFGKRWLSFLYSPQVRANRLLAIAESGRTNLGRLTYERGVLRSHRRVSAYLAETMQRGLLREADPGIATKHLFGLLECELLEACLFRVLGEVDAARIKEVVARAVEVFMAAYGPREAGR